MKIAGLIKHSLIDYPGKIAAVVFTQGCNFRCGFCHNPDLLDITAEGSLNEESILSFLEKRVGLLDGVVITGGEPTLQPDLVQFVKKIKNLGMLIKLDTNGSNPRLLKKLLEEDLVDYVAMDVKGPLAKYSEICAYLNTKIIQESIDLLLSAKDLEYEFRTTLLPYYHSKEDIVEIGKLISGAKKYTLQGFRPEITFDSSLANEKSFRAEELNEFASILEKHIKTVIVLDNL